MELGDRLIETVTLRQAKALIQCMAHEQSIVMLSPPGMGKSDTVVQAAAEAGLPCRSLLGTQIAPEDVSGIPRIDGERSIFCPPRVLLPESNEPFCLFLDELPACTPDIQKAFYSLLLERRLGEHPLPKGTWVVAAGNRAEDRALVRSLSSALVNRVIILQIEIDVEAWLTWARANNVRQEIISFITEHPEALMRSVPEEPQPFSTPRSWASLSRAFDLVEESANSDLDLRLALAMGRVSQNDAYSLCQREGDGVPRGALLTRIEDLRLSVRATNCLESEGLSTLLDLVQRSEAELLEVRNFGETTLAEVKEMLSQRGLALGSKVSEASGSSTVTLRQAKSLIRSMAHEQSLLLLSAPGVGKSDTVAQTAQEAGLQCRSLLGTQIAPEDVSGIPRIVGERSVFCPPRMLLPEEPKPFCLFLDELPACTADIQKAFYSLLLERRLGEHALPEGTWVVAAGNRAEDRALVRSLSAALINRVFLLHIDAAPDEWIDWAKEHGVRKQIVEFIEQNPEALLRSPPTGPLPFSTPRAWTSLANALDLAEQADFLTPELEFALAHARVSDEDARSFCRPLESIPDVALVEAIERFDSGKYEYPREKIRMIKDVRRATEAGLRDSKLAVERAFEMTAEERVQFCARLAARAKEEKRIFRLPSDPPTITLGEARALIPTLAHEESLLFLSAPGVGKSDMVTQTAREAELVCRSLLGTQIAPEDVSGIPRIVGERSVFCPPRVLLPENPEAFCLFLDELPACNPDIQKAFYSLLLERRLGEHPLPEGTWVLAAGNRAKDRALVRALSTALINRVFLLDVRVDVKEWLVWAKEAGVRTEILAFITFLPEALMRPVPSEPVPFSTPRAWHSLSRSLDLAEAAGILDDSTRRALTFGRISATDAAVFTAMAEEAIDELRPIEEYFDHPDRLPTTDTARWFVVSRIRTMVQREELVGFPKETVNTFLEAIPEEHRFALLVDLVEQWAKLGAEAIMIETLKDVTGL